MGDIVGRLFREFAVTLSVTILVSAVVSLTLTPMMCAPAAAATSRESQQGRFYRASERVFERDHRVLRPHARAGCSAPARRRCWSPSPRSSLTVAALRRHPEGLLPGAGHRRHPGRLRGAADVSFPRDGRAAAGAGRRRSCRIPAVESLSSFIGVDGTNTTLNSGRIQINLKPLDERDVSASDVIRRLQPKLAEVDGHHALSCSRCRTCTVEDRVSRTQFQYTLEDADADELATWAPQLRRQAAASCPSCATSPAISRTAGCRRSW